MKRKTLLLCIALTALVGLIAIYMDPGKRLMGLLRGDTFFLDRPTCYWSDSLASQDPAVQAEAIRKLTEARGEALPVLRELITSNPGSDAKALAVRTEALNLVAKSGAAADQVSEILISSLEDPDRSVRVVAAKALGTISGPLPDRAISPLMTQLESQEKVPFIYALSKFGPRAAAAIPALRLLLKADDSDVRWNAARTLGKIGPASREVLTDLFPLFGDAVDQVREHAAEAIGDIGPTAAEAIPYLEKALTDRYFKVRRDAVRSLGQIGEPAKGALPKMFPLLEDENELVREAARKAIRILDPKANVEGKK